MKPEITINIKNLIGTVVITGDGKNASSQIQELCNDALNRALKTASEFNPSRAESINKNGSNAKER